MVKNNKLRLLSYVVIAYMLLVFAWWSVLLYTKNKDAYNAKLKYWELIMVAQGDISNAHEFTHTPKYEELTKKYKSHELMIFGEGAVFVLSLAIGIWLINRGYNREMIAAQQSRNFLLSITHELKSPIASIRLVLETFLKRDLHKELFNKLGNNALSETERLTSLVDNLLLAAKMETAYQPVIEEINVVELLEEMISKVRTKFPKVTVKFDSDLNSAYVNGDSMGLTSVILNLIENAIKYSPDPAEIAVALAHSKENILIAFADKGFGIPDSEKSNIFNKFYRIGNEDTRKTKGTGLGLYIVNEIVRAHNGKINIADNNPKGTIFKVYLPQIKN